MSSLELDARRERAGRNQSLFREVNERLDDLTQRFADEELPQYVCECLDLSCTELIAVPHEEYARTRETTTDFFVLPGHEVLDVEEVVHRTKGWLVVRKLGVAAEVATELATSLGS